MALPGPMLGMARRRHLLLCEKAHLPWSSATAVKCNGCKWIRYRSPQRPDKTEVQAAKNAAVDLLKFAMNHLNKF